MNKQEFLARANAVMEEMFHNFQKLPVAYLEDFNPQNTAVVIVDMINGFTKFGPLHSDRCDNIIPTMTTVLERFKNQGFPIIAFADEHPADSPEFENYPPHCLKGTAESEIVPEIEKIGGYIRIPKNSTNGYLEPQFQEWLKENGQINTFIVVGVCTDICVQQFAITLKTHFQRLNQKVEIVVPKELVETFDLGVHYGDLMHLMGLQFMKNAGVRIVRDIE